MKYPVGFSCKGICRQVILLCYVLIYEVKIEIFFCKIVNIFGQILLDRIRNNYPFPRDDETITRISYVEAI